MIPAPWLRRGLAEAFRPGRDAVLQNWRPFVLIQVCILGVVAAYYALSPVRGFFVAVVEYKTSAGIAFAAISTAIAGAVLPEIARRVTRVERDRPLTWADAAFQLAYFGSLGIMLDTLYRLLGVIFGDSPAPAVVFSKLAADMVIFSALISMPMAAALFAWRDAEYKLPATRRLLAGGGFMRRYLPLIVMCWAFWIPVMMCVYALPVLVQFPVAVLAEAAWSLLLVHMAAHRVPPEGAT